MRNVSGRNSSVGSSGGLGGSVSGPLALSFAKQYSVMLFRLSIFFVLARLLTPRDYGIFASSQACIGLCGTLVDMGMSQFLIRVRVLTLAIRRTALGLSLAAAALVMSVVLGACLP